MGKGGGGGGGGEQDQNSYTLLWIIAGVFVVSAIIWHFYSNQLKIAFIIVKKYEVLAISFFVDNENIRRAIEGLNMATPANLNLYYASKISVFIGEYLMYPVCFVLLVLAIIMFKGSATMRFNKAYNMDSLVQQEKENYPQIAPVADLDLIAEDMGKGPWAMSMNPMQFARHYKLLKVELIPDRKAAWRTEGIPKATLIRENATQVFSNQLGSLWTGVEHLPPHTKALYAAFIARADHDTDACRGYLAKLARTAAKGSIDYSDTEPFLKKYGKNKAVELCQKRHAYVLTIMASILQLARIDGVLASSDFLWVKPVDRRLWYVLNCVGRQVSVPEVAGVFSHWFAEKEMGKPLTVPMVEAAVDALNLGLEKMIYIPEEGEVIAPASTGHDIEVR